MPQSTQTNLNYEIGRWLGHGAAIVRIYLDPAREVPAVISETYCTSTDYSVSEHNGIFIELAHFTPRTRVKHVREALLAHEEQILELARKFEKVEWDGSNWSGSWLAPPDAAYLREAIAFEIQRGAFVDRRG